ncbi:inversin-like [Plakobranchus ocellatus]|uniref:Inversin-like n=1 Tax=Plakobranchus ocellatus TaxID=259542 RepID=A0AAV4CAS3_9GAST|nr:inversin-like [Plakobranchus ocellatus]
MAAAQAKRRTAIFQDCTKVSVHKKRLRATQEEWEKQIAALTIQLAWRKFFRRKLLRALHPNRRQLLMWDPEIVALKQQALVHYIYNEHIEAPFWHPTLRPAIRPLWTRFIPSAAAVSYNFAVDQYYPWVARAGAIPEFPPGTEPEMLPVCASPKPEPAWSGSNEGAERQKSGGGSRTGSRANSDRLSDASGQQQKPASGNNKKSARFSYNMRKK